MSRLRLLLAWLLLAALPLQGLAAASMLYCSGTMHGPAAVDVAAPGDAAHDHAAHGHANAGTPGATDNSPSLPDATHSCGVCASCCNLVAITDLPRMPIFGILPQQESAEPFAPMHAPLAARPDKPPRV